VTDFPEGRIVAVDVGGEDVAVVNWHDRFFAFANLCTHLGTPLSVGYVTNANEVVCMLHDSVFDMATGKALDGPTNEDIPVYSVRLAGEDVLVGKD
jgi:3-phenylpropionate/trans-cinnamate dioxygenase ferredoxin subunit